MGWLDARYDAEFAHERLVGGRDDLGVFDAEAAVVLLRLRHAGGLCGKEDLG